ncbi:aspartate aminotransferase family protein [Maridesulfovibrio salexigens]|uniref:Taurine--pyruvate aminotransferase n=1 Tax=Maridesulfovibrio salexigens (strain ATCC 14822 / DSM 2638 / NCIMB 8403 / VKM B-1763) TaxID=526222 RepID=C6BZI2_MARSD|nr:aspartate aminotransferase family protein [Maridesulfovibrio salexigens]ACS80819.1 aminotransferase class-III [Maridesulfovibrio salexigens DSM 2638]
MSSEIVNKYRERMAEAYDLHRKFVNPQFVRVLEVIGYDRNYVSSEGAYLTDAKGVQVLDFLSGFGVYNIGRNHPHVADVLKEVMDEKTASIVQMDLGVMSGMLAEKLAELAPGDLEAVFFTNSGTEGVEGALKFARQASGKHKLVHCHHAFHGLTLGSLSVNANHEFRDRNEPLLPDCVPVPFNDLAALEEALKGGDVGAFIFETVQGKGVFVPEDGYLEGVRELCDKYGTYMIADEVQCGMGRTGKMFAVDHWGVKPDILVISKALSGGYIPVGAIITTREIHGKIFDSMERCFAHSNTFGQNDLAMAAGLATFEVLEREKLVENAARMGQRIEEGLQNLADKYEMLTEVRAKGLMIGMQFGEPKSMALKASWKLLHKMNDDLFCQMITMPLLEKHNILSQVAGHGLDTVKILPPLMINDEDVDKFIAAMDDVLKEAHKITGSAWKTVKDLGIRTAKTS